MRTKKPTKSASIWGITFTTPRKTNATRDVSQNVSKDTVSKTVSTVTNGAPLDAAGKCTPTDHAPMSSPETLIAVVENADKNESESVLSGSPPRNISTPNIIFLFCYYLSISEPLLKNC